MLLYIQLQLREEKCTSVFTDSVSHKTRQKNDSIIGPLTACDTGLWANFEFKIWPYSPFLEWFLSVLFLSKYVDIVYTAFQNFYTLHIPLERILYFCNYPETNLYFRKLFYLIPSLIYISCMNHQKNGMTNFSVHRIILQECKQNNTENKSHKQNIKKY